MTSLQNATRDQLLDRIAEVCYNEGYDEISGKKWTDMTDDQLRSVVSLINEELFTLFRQSTGKRHCHLSESLFEYIRMKALAEEPRTGRVYTPTERSKIVAVMKMFFPDQRQVIEQVEQFIQNLNQDPDFDAEFTIKMEHEMSMIENQVPTALQSWNAMNVAITQFNQALDTLLTIRQTTRSMAREVQRVKDLFEEREETVGLSNQDYAWFNRLDEEESVLIDVYIPIDYELKNAFMRINDTYHAWGQSNFLTNP